jgi:hypothetical protein
MLATLAVSPVDRTILCGMMVGEGADLMLIEGFRQATARHAMGQR